jgi:hypothetical protein
MNRLLTTNRVGILQVTIGNSALTRAVEGNKKPQLIQISGNLYYNN